MIKETTIDNLFGEYSTYLITTFWSNIHVSIDAISMQDALNKFTSIIPYGYALGPSVIKIRKGSSENN